MKGTDFSGAPAEARLTQVYDEHWRAVLAFGLRRGQRPEDAADLVAETFLVAWRRFADMPSGEETRVWLYAVARRLLANQQRGERRRLRLASRLRDELATSVSRGAVTESESTAMRALNRLEEGDREVLMLTGWEELAPTQIASVLGLSPTAVRSRLHRARRRFRVELEAETAESRVAATVAVKEA